jgi:hypothetical protein
MRHNAVVTLLLSVIALPMLSQHRAGTGETFTSVPANDGTAPRWVRSSVPPSAFGFQFGPRKATQAPPTKRRPVIEPALERAVEKGAPDELAEVIITFKDELVLTPLPSGNGAPSLAGSRNDELIAERRAAISRIQQERAAKHASRNTDLAPLGVTTIATMWLTDAIVARVPYGRIRAIAARNDVVGIERTTSDRRLPNVSSGRAQMGTEHLFYSADANSWVARPRIAVLDSGSPVDHIQFGNRSRIEIERDCTNVVAQDTNCRINTSGWNPRDTANCNHGMSSIAILAALATQGEQYRGVPIPDRFLQGVAVLP